MKPEDLRAIIEIEDTTISGYAAMLAQFTSLDPMRALLMATYIQQKQVRDDKPETMHQIGISFRLAELVASEQAEMLVDENGEIFFQTEDGTDVRDLINKDDMTLWRKALRK
jgi:hypothetical protein